MLPIGLQHKWYSGGRQKVLSAIVRDANRQALAYVYFEEVPGRRAAARLLTRDEARRIAANIAKLPEAAAQTLKSSVSQNKASELRDRAGKTLVTMAISVPPGIRRQAP